MIKNLITKYAWLNRKKIWAFIQGNWRYYFRAFLPKHIKEQIAFRASVCEQCVDEGKCISCGCHVPQKFYATAQCSAMVWPKLMSKDEWKEYNDENKRQTNSS